MRVCCHVRLLIWASYPGRLFAPCWLCTDSDRSRRRQDPLALAMVLCRERLQCRRHKVQVVPRNSRSHPRWCWSYFPSRISAHHPVRFFSDIVRDADRKVFVWTERLSHISWFAFVANTVVQTKPASVLKPSCCYTAVPSYLWLSLSFHMTEAPCRVR